MSKPTGGDMTTRKRPLFKAAPLWSASPHIAVRTRLRPSAPASAGR